MTNYVSLPLPLEGADNARDLGGYPAAGGRTTKSGVFLRSDALDGLTEADREALRAYGVRLILDLRGDTEARRAPDPAIDGAEYRRVSIIDEANSRAAEIAEGETKEMAFPENMGVLYVERLRNGGALFADAVRALAFCPGVGLFHCSAGKDRTGVVAMLLLKLCGVPDEDVIRDYSVTEGYMQAKFAAARAMMRDMGVEAVGAMFSSAPKNMEMALAYLEELGGAEAYLTAHGLEPEAVAAVRRKLLGDA